jgi:hypothetical protein
MKNSGKNYTRVFLDRWLATLGSKAWRKIAKRRQKRRDKRWNDANRKSSSLNVWSSSRCRSEVVPKRLKPRNLPVN